MGNSVPGIQCCVTDVGEKQEVETLLIAQAALSLDAHMVGVAEILTASKSALQKSVSGDTSTDTATTTDTTDYPPFMSESLGPYQSQSSVQSIESKATQVKKQLSMEQIEVRRSLSTCLKKTLAGISVTLITPAGRKVETSPAKMRIEADYSQITIEAGPKTCTFPVAKLADIYQIDSDGDEVFPPVIVDQVSADDLEKLLRVDFNVDGGKSKNKYQKIYLLEESIEGRDALLSTLKVVRRHVMKADTRT